PGPGPGPPGHTLPADRRAVGPAPDQPDRRPGVASWRSQAPRRRDRRPARRGDLPVRGPVPPGASPARPAYPPRLAHAAVVPRPPVEPALPVLPGPFVRRPPDAAAIERPGSRDPDVERAVRPARRRPRLALPAHPGPGEPAPGRPGPRPRRALPGHVLPVPGPQARAGQPDDQQGGPLVESPHRDVVGHG